MVEAVVLSWVLLLSCGVAAQEDNLSTTLKSDQPKIFKYYHAWASKDGETHFAKCNMQGFNLSIYASLPQYLRSDFGGEPFKLVFTELPVGFNQPLHSPPQVQFVVTLSGSWYVKTTDGTHHIFHKGDVLLEDTPKTTPSVKQPLHYSGVAGKKPCHLMFVQFSRPPQVDNPCPFKS